MTSFLLRLLRRPAAPPVQAAPAPPVTAVPPRGLVPELLHEEQVSAEMLLSLFRQAFVPVEVHPDGGLMATTETGMRLLVIVDPGRKLIGMSATYALRAEVERAEKLAFVNRVNDRVIFVRFSLLSDEVLYVDHQLPFDGGVTAAAVMGCLRRIGRIAPQAIVEFAGPDLLKQG